MDNFTNLSSTSNTSEQEKNDSKKVYDFLTKAEHISEKSSSRDICKLISEISDYEQYHATFFRDVLVTLQQLLSNCISSKCNCTNCGFVKLRTYINTEKETLKNLNFV